MSLFPNPETHASNPPDSWQVHKLAERNWALTTQSGDRLETGLRTRREAEELRSTGFYVSLYNDESRWYAGLPTSRPWRPYADVLAEQAYNAGPSIPAST